MYVFYRQGDTFTIDPTNPESCLAQKLGPKDLGQMILIYEKILVVRSSSSYLFFKRDEKGMWQEYDRLENKRGNLYFIKGNYRIQITTDEKIYFYKIDTETLKPVLDNVMRNFMECSQMMFGSNVRYSITYKTGQPGFTIYTRTFSHNFSACLAETNYEGSHGVNLSAFNQYVIGEHTHIRIFNREDYKIV